MDEFGLGTDYIIFNIFDNKENIFKTIITILNASFVSDM